MEEHARSRRRGSQQPSTFDGDSARAPSVYAAFTPGVAFDTLAHVRADDAQLRLRTLDEARREKRGS